MDRVSRPLIGLLVATVAFFALWVTMLKPSSPTSGANPGNLAKNPGLGQLTGAIAAAHGAVATSNATSVRHGGTVVSATASAAPVHPAPTSSATPAAGVVHHPVRARAHPARRTHVVPVRLRLTAAGRLRLVTRALAAHKVLALLFFNPGGADDRAVDRELASVPIHHGAVVKLAIPLLEVASYVTLTAQAPVSSSPTLLIIDRRQSASELLGFADRFEIAQRVADALAVK